MTGPFPEVSTTVPGAREGEATASAVGDTGRVPWAPQVLVGAVCGLAWAASLRAVMAEFAGRDATFSWFGTFEGVLLPGAVVGGLLGWALYRQSRGGAQRWLVAAPLLFPLATPAVLVSVFVDGLGGGALAVPLIGMAGGYALAGQGPRWTRWATGAVALLAVPGWLAIATIIGGPLALGTPRGAWLAVLFLCLLAVLAMACTLPLRAPAELLTSRRRLVLVGVVCGLAWGAGMRGFMAAAAGLDSPSVVSWFGTFGIILPISGVVGGLLGWAEDLRRTGGRTRRIHRLAPLLFTVDPASLVVTLPALAGGYVLAGRGSRRARWALGACAVLPVPAFFAAVAVVDRSLRELGGPRAAWIAVLLFSLLAVLTVACAIPQRVPDPVPETASTPREDESVDEASE